MAIKKVIVPASHIQVGHIVDNRKAEAPLEVLSVEGFTKFGVNTYTISVGRNGVEEYEAVLQDNHVLTYTYVEKEDK